jgi:hypothetical protein
MCFSRANGSRARSMFARTDDFGCKLHLKDKQLNSKNGFVDVVVRYCTPAPSFRF